MVSISRSLRLRSLRNLPCCRSACQGGIARVLTLSRIAAAHGRASRNVISDIGATSPGRWQVAHRAWKIGAMSRLNVGPPAGGADEGRCGAAVMATADDRTRTKLAIL